LKTITIVLPEGATEIAAMTYEEREALMARMRAAWERVKPEGNWKNPIGKFVVEPDAAKRQEIADAIYWFTGTRANVIEWDAWEDHTWLFEAPGYYAGPCN